MSDALHAGRDAFRRTAWREAATELAHADAAAALGADDLDLLATAQYLSGADAQCEATWIRAHHEALKDARWDLAARCAFWLSITLTARSERAKAGGWLARAARVLDDSQHDCVERGWLLIPMGLRHYYGGEFDAAIAAFEDARAIAQRFDDADLAPTALQALGRATIRAGRIDEGVALLDEAMIAVIAGEVSPIPAGIIYCSVIEICREILDVRRAQEWTAALTAWCASQPDLVPYQGRCLIHRSEVLQMQGDWPSAMAQANEACRRLATPPQPQLGMAYYQKGEMHRLRGELEQAEDAYRVAKERRREPEPGLSLIRLARGETRSAGAAIRRVLDGAVDAVARSELLPAAVDILVTGGDPDPAREYAAEMHGIASGQSAPFLRGLAHRASAVAHLGSGDAPAAHEEARAALDAWSDLEVPYEVARARVVLARALDAEGDPAAADAERVAAVTTFRALGAASDLAVVDSAQGRQPALSAREVEVLALVAQGLSNRDIGDALFISDRTVARHMSNIFGKLGVSTRAAATALGLERGLI